MAADRTPRGDPMTESPQDVPPQSQGQTPPQGGYPPQQPPQQPQPSQHEPVPYPGYAVQPPLSPGDARMWSIFAHLGGTFLSFIVPLVIHLVFKDRDPFVREHSSAALVFTIIASVAANDGREYTYPLAIQFVH